MIVPNTKQTKAPNIQKDLNTYIYNKVYSMDGPEIRICLIEFMKFGVVKGSSFKDTNIINEEGTVICQGVENTSNFTDQILELLCNLGYKIEEDKDDS